MKFQILILDIQFDDSIEQTYLLISKEIVKINFHFLLEMILKTR